MADTCVYLLNLANEKFDTLLGGGTKLNPSPTIEGGHLYSSPTRGGGWEGEKEDFMPPFVIAAMEQLAAEGATNIVGFEANGGFLLGSRLEKAGRVLEPLPTRDAVLPILALLAMARERGVPVSRLAAGLPPRFTASDRVQNFPTENSRALLQALAGSAATLAEFLSPLGLAAAGLDQTDGLRITLANGEILHLRPSGNAPELRCYAEAESQERANELAKAGLGRVGSWRG